MVNRLEDLRQKISDTGVTVFLRGTGAATFVFAEHHGRAIEASLKNNEWWIEFWDVDADEDAAPVREETVSVDRDAFQISATWLKAVEAN